LRTTSAEQVIGVQFDYVEGKEEHAAVVATVVKPVEAWNAVPGASHHLAVDGNVGHSTGSTNVGLGTRSRDFQALGSRTSLRG
jgi:hypothetical protein